MEDALRVAVRGGGRPEAGWLDEALRDLGHDVRRDLSPGDRPDLLLVHDPAAVREGELDLFRRSGTLRVLRAYGDPDAFEEGRRMAANYDWVLTTGLAEMARLYESIGARALPLLPAAPPEFCAVPTGAPRDIDVVFAGRLDGHERARRLEFLRHASRRWRVAVATDSPGVWEGARPLEDPVALAHLHARSKISFHLDRIAMNRWGITRNFPGVRVFAGPAAGAVLLANLLPWANHVYDVAEEIAGFEEVDHALQVAEGLLADLERLAGMARAGRARVLAEHTFIHRARQVAALARGEVPLSMRVLALGPWYQSIELPGGVTTSHLARSNVLRRARLEPFFPDVRGKSVLDLGANAGFFSIECARRGAARVVAVDSSELACEQARFAVGLLEASGIEIVHAGLFAAPPGPFDVCLLLAVLHQLPPPAATLAAAAARAPEILLEWAVREKPHHYPVERILGELGALGLESTVLAGGERPIVRAVRRQARP